MSFFNEEIDAIIGIRTASSPAILLESSGATSPETLDLSARQRCEMLMLEHGVYLRLRSLLVPADGTALNTELSLTFTIFAGYSPYEYRGGDARNIQSRTNENAASY